MRTAGPGPLGGIGQRDTAMTECLDEHRGIDGWAIAHAEACGVLIDAIAVYVNASTYAVGSSHDGWCRVIRRASTKCERTNRRVPPAAAQIAAVASAARDAISIGLGGGELTRPHGSNDHVIFVTLPNNDGCMPAPFFNRMLRALLFVHSVPWSLVIRTRMAIFFIRGGQKRDRGYGTYPLG